MKSKAGDAKSARPAKADPKKALGSAGKKPAPKPAPRPAKAAPPPPKNKKPAPPPAKAAPPKGKGKGPDPKAKVIDAKKKLDPKAKAAPDPKAKAAIDPKAAKAIDPKTKGKAVEPPKAAPRPGDAKSTRPGPAADAKSARPAPATDTKSARPGPATDAKSARPGPSAAAEPKKGPPPKPAKASKGPKGSDDPFELGIEDDDELPRPEPKPSRAKGEKPPKAPARISPSDMPVEKPPTVKWAEAKEETAWHEDWDFGDDEIGGLDDDSPFGLTDDTDVPATEDAEDESDGDDDEEEGGGEEEDDPRPRRRRGGGGAAKKPAPRDSEAPESKDEPEDDEAEDGDDDDDDDTEGSADEDAGEAPAGDDEDGPRGERRRSKTIARKQMLRERRRMVAQGVMPEIMDYDRPMRREQCKDGPRPCLYVSCRFHLYLDVNPATGSIKLNFPDKEIWQLAHTCALDVAEKGGITLEEVGDIMNLTRERIRQVEVTGLAKLKNGDAALETFVDGRELDD